MNAMKLIGWTIAAALVVLCLSVIADCSSVIRGIEFTDGETFFWNIARGLCLIVILTDLTAFGFLWWLRSPVLRGR